MEVTVLKIGGSLIETGAAREFMQTLAARRPARLVIVAGGGTFADAVRRSDAAYGLTPLASHHMALLAMEMSGRLLQDLAPGFQLCPEVEAMTGTWKDARIPIWAPARLVLAAPDIPASWDFTSDSLAAWLALRLHAQRLIVLKSCEVPEEQAQDAQALAQAGIVDSFFPEMVAAAAFRWVVVSGLHAALANCDLSR